MAETKKDNEYSLQHAMDKLAQILRIISEDKKEIFIKKPEQVNEALLLKLSESLLECATLFNDLVDIWNGSKSKGIDAFQKTDTLEERIDFKLYSTGKLDFEQMKKIMGRLNRLDDALTMEEIITPYLRQYEYLCKEKKVFKAYNFAETFETYFVEVFKKHLLNEKSRLGNQIERCNLYYQAKLNTSTVKIAYVALAVSIISALLTILGLTVFK